MADKINYLTASKMSKYGVFSGPYFPVFGLNTEKYGPDKTQYLDTFHAVSYSIIGKRVRALTSFHFNIFLKKV